MFSSASNVCSVLLLFLCLLPSLCVFGSGVDIKSTISNLHGILEYTNIENNCDLDENWWEFSVGSSHEYNEIRAGKHETEIRNLTWFGFAMDEVQLGISTLYFNEDLINSKYYSFFADNLFNMFGGLCKKGIAPLSTLHRSPASQCTVNKNLGLCPETDGWNRVFIWFNWARNHLMSAPLGIELRTIGDEHYITAITMAAAQKNIQVFDSEVMDTGGSIYERTSRLPTLGLEFFFKMFSTSYDNVKKAIHTVKNAYGKQILEIQESFFEFDESPLEFEKFSFGVPYQDEARNRANKVVFQVKSDHRQQIKSLYTFKMYGNDFHYLGNETITEWSTGEVERWRFVQMVSPINLSVGSIEEYRIYNTDGTCYEVAKFVLPRMNVSVYRGWYKHMDTKKVYFVFLEDSIFPPIDAHYISDRSSLYVFFNVRNIGHVSMVNCSYILEDDNVRSWSVKISDMVAEGVYKNERDVLRGSIQYHSSHLQLVVGKTFTFVSDYTQVLTYLHMLIELFYVNYGKIIYNIVEREIGEEYIDMCINMLANLPPIEELYYNLADISGWVHPKEWQKYFDYAYQYLNRIDGVEETEKEYIFYYDLSKSPFAFVLNWINLSQWN